MKVWISLRWEHVWKRYNQKKLRVWKILLLFNSLVLALLSGSSHMGKSFNVNMGGKPIYSSVDLNHQSVILLALIEVLARNNVTLALSQLSREPSVSSCSPARHLVRDRWSKGLHIFDSKPWHFLVITRRSFLWVCVGLGLFFFFLELLWTVLLVQSVEYKKRRRLCAKEKANQFHTSGWARLPSCFWYYVQLIVVIERSILAFCPRALLPKG